MNPLAVVPLNDELRAAWLDATLKANIAAQIRGLRESRKMTQAQAAELIGITQARLSVLENPRRCNPTMTTLKRIAAAFDVALIVRFCSFGEYVLFITQDIVHIMGLDEEIEWQPIS